MADVSFRIWVAYEQDKDYMFRSVSPTNWIIEHFSGKWRDALVWGYFSCCESHELIFVCNWALSVPTIIATNCSAQETWARLHSRPAAASFPSIPLIHPADVPGNQGFECGLLAVGSGGRSASATGGALDSSSSWPSSAWSLGVWRSDFAVSTPSSSHGMPIASAPALFRVDEGNQHSVTMSLAEKSGWTEGASLWVRSQMWSSFWDALRKWVCPFPLMEELILTWKSAGGNCLCCDKLSGAPAFWGVLVLLIATDIKWNVERWRLCRFSKCRWKESGGGSNQGYSVFRNGQPKDADESAIIATTTQMKSLER